MSSVTLRLSLRAEGLSLNSFSDGNSGVGDDVGLIFRLVLVVDRSGTLRFSLLLCWNLPNGPLVIFNFAGLARRVV